MASVASAATDGRLDVRTGSPEGPLVAAIDVPDTGGESTWRTLTAQASSVTGTHDLYFVYNANGRHIRFNVDYWQFDR